MPVTAVSHAGFPYVKVGSTKDKVGTRVGPARSRFSFVVAFAITEKGVTSDPVPEVVGMAISGFQMDAGSAIDPSSLHARAALAASRGLPPPNATMQSHPPLACWIRLTILESGSPTTSSNTRAVGKARRKSWM